jgi:glycosyltransferase involved in cell wall biosynthesis
MRPELETRAFESATIILPVMNETTSFVETVEAILASSEKDICEFLVVVCDKTKPESLAVINSLESNPENKIVVLQQRLPFLGGAMRDAFAQAHGSHTIMMASDLETDPALVPHLIAAARRKPDAIITVSRWIEGGGFHRYSRAKLIANWFFQKMFSLLYGTHLSDMTFGYRIFPTRLIAAIKWEELRHPFLFETLIKPLRLGVEIEEIPGFWRGRTEGESQNTFARNFAYFGIGLRTRFASPRRMLR